MRAGLIAGAIMALAGMVNAEPLATVGGVEIGRDAVEKAVKAKLVEVDNSRYEALREGVDELVADELVKQEAKARNVTPEALIDQEVTKKLAEPTDAEIQKVFDDNKAQLGAQTLEQIKPRIVEYLKGQAQETRKQAFLDELKKKYPTKIMLKAPRVDIGTGKAAIKGPATAPILIVEFSDYECPYCKKAEPAMQEVFKTYGDKVRFAYRHYPLPFHQAATPASVAALCARAQGKFWEYHEKVFAASSLAIDNLKKIAGEVGLDQAKFDACLTKNEFLPEVQADMADGSSVGVTGTPAFFINGRMLSGAQPFEAFKEIIDDELGSAQ